MKRTAQVLARAIRIGLIATTLMTVGCAQLPLTEDGNTNEEPTASFKMPHIEPSQPAPARTPPAVRLRPGLILNVTVLAGGSIEISEENKRISDSGTLALPLIGEIKAQGHSLSSMRALLAKAYSRYFVNPQIMVDLVHDDTREGVAPWGYVTVLGRVRKPGRIPIPSTRDMTVTRAIQHAGGLDTSARANAIRITRQSPDGAMKTIDVDLHAVGVRGDVDQDILLQSEDVVFVPERIF